MGAAGVAVVATEGVVAVAAEEEGRGEVVAEAEAGTAEVEAGGCVCAEDGRAGSGVERCGRCQVRGLGDEAVGAATGGDAADMVMGCVATPPGCGAVGGGAGTGARPCGPTGTGAEEEAGRGDVAAPSTGGGRGEVDGGGGI